MKKSLACLSLLLLLPGAALCVPAKPSTLVTAEFPQRRADRWTTAHGLPGKKVVAIQASGKGDNTAVRVQTEAGAAAFSGGMWSGATGTVAPDRSFVDPSKLPAGTKITDAAKGADGTVWVVTETGVFRSRNGAYERVPFPSTYLTHQRPVNIDAKIECVATDSAGMVWFGGSTGLFATDGGNFWNVVDREDGLPFEYVTCLTLAPNGEIWVGTTEGVCRQTLSGDWQYYWGPRWLPHNRVNAIAVDGDGAAWVATDGGVARLYDDNTTLAAKARHFQRVTDERHTRHGFITGARLKEPGKPQAGVILEASDNDGLWTAIYVGAQVFRYAATKDAEARTKARNSMRALLNLVKYTGIPGFPARALIFKGEEVDGYDANETVRVDGETDKIWFRSPVDPDVLCKGDTSSDELDGHYFAWQVYHDLVATPEEKRELKSVVGAVTDNILNHDLTLVGPTGRKTRWGVWHPKYINDDPTWWEERGLNALEMLGYLKIAEHICGDAKYGQKYRELIEKHHFLLNTVDQKVATNWWDMNHSDDQMAFLIYYSLLQLERDPAIRRVLLQSLERSWQIERPEESPFFNFVYGAVTGRPCDAEASASALRDWPWELVEWQTRGSHRHDVTLLSHTSEGQTRTRTAKVLPASERRIMRWNGNPFGADGGSPTGASEDDGSAWLLPYWLGRYHRLLE
jgi:hypothetical protein